MSFPAAGSPPPAPSVTPAPAITTTPTPASVRPAPNPAPAERNPRIIAYGEAVRVAGIRPSDTDPRVLMNDRVFRLNDVVDRKLGLRLTAVEALCLIFTAEARFDYEKRF